MAKPLDLQDIHVSNVGYDHTRAALGWRHDGAWFHIWVTLPDLTPGGAITTASKPLTIFKNPLADRGEPGHFDTRRLDGTKKLGRQMIEQATAFAISNNLAAAAIAERVAEEAAEQAKNEAAMRQHRKEQAAGALYDALKLAHDSITDDSEIRHVRDTIAAVLKSADEGPKP